ncbi:MAG: rpoD [Gammaproteobacteria bacterium]|nr:rpoD [Gammaproteobacteria bacterium]
MSQQFDLDQDRHSKIRRLIAIGQKRGYLYYPEIYEVLPDDTDPERIEEIVSNLVNIGIELKEGNPEEDVLLADDEEESGDSGDIEEEDVEEVAEALVTLTTDAELGRTTHSSSGDDFSGLFGCQCRVIEILRSSF